MDDVTSISTMISAGGGSLGVLFWFIRRLISQHEERLTAVEKKVEEKFDDLIKAVHDVRIAVVAAQHTQRDVDRLFFDLDDVKNRLMRLESR